MGVVARAIRFYRANGARALPTKITSYLKRTFINPFIPNHVSKRRQILGELLFKQSNGTVLAGPLEGFQLNPFSKWGASAFGPMLLGTYEAPVLNTLIALGKTADLLIDIGAADGYFGVGLVAKGYFNKSACFELDPDMRSALTDVARLNGVEEKVLTFGAADNQLAEQLLAAGIPLSNAVVLCDIEGAEFDVFTPHLLDVLKSCSIIVELHEAYFEDGKERLAQLIEDAEEHFNIGFVDRGPRELPGHKLVRHLIEDDRWLLASEGRCVDQRWLLLQPRGA